MSNLFVYLPLIFFSFFIYLFFLWRRLKEDYVSSFIFTSGITLYLAVGVFAFLFHFVSTQLRDIAYFNPHGAWFLGASLGFFITTYTLTRRYSFKFFELFNASTFALLIPLLLLYIAHFLLTNEVTSAYIAFVTGLALVLFIVVSQSYRKFTWYKSGKIGIAALFSLGIYFAARVYFALNFETMVSLLGRIDFIYSGVIAFCMFFIIYQLSESD